MCTDADIRDKYHTKFGGFNDFPPNFIPITVKEFGSKMTHYDFDYSEYRQMYKDDDLYATPAVSAKLFFFWDDTGVAITRAGELYSFGCDHTMENIPWDRETMGPQFNCTNAYKCSKCGFVQVLDSSD